MLQGFKPEIKTFFIVALVAIILAVGGILLLRVLTPISSPTPIVQQTPPPAPSLQPQAINNQQSTIDTSTWQTYRNEEFGFEVRFPRDWSHEKDNLANFFFPPEMKGNRQGSIVVIVIDKANLPPPIELNTQRQAYDISHLKTLRVVKWEGKEIPVKETGSAYEQYLAQVENESYIFRFSFQNLLDRKYDVVFDQILSTFRFVE